jgi:ribonuclease P protein component
MVSSLPTPSLAFPRRLRLTHAREYQTVYGHKVRKPLGLLVVYGAPNGKAEHRLGLAIHRRVGNSVVRNRVKRLIREAFRLDRQNYTLLNSALGCDLVVQAKPNHTESGLLDDYRAWLGAAVQGVVKELDRRAARDAAREGTRATDQDEGGT